MARRPTPDGQVRIHLARLEGLRTAIARALAAGDDAGLSILQAQRDAAVAAIRELCGRWKLEVPAGLDG